MPRSLDPFRFLLVAVAGWMNQRQLQVINYLREEDRILREQLGARRLRLNDDQRRRLAAKARGLGRKILAEVATIVTPETLLAWYRKLIAQKYDVSRQRRRRPCGGSEQVKGAEHQTQGLTEDTHAPCSQVVWGLRQGQGTKRAEFSLPVYSFSPSHQSWSDSTGPTLPQFWPPEDRRTVQLRGYVRGGAHNRLIEPRVEELSDGGIAILMRSQHDG